MCANDPPEYYIPSTPEQIVRNRAIWAEAGRRLNEREPDDDPA